MDEKFFKEYFGNYAQGYDHFDPEYLAGYYFAPTLMVKNGTVVTLTTPDEILYYLKSMLTTYKEHGYKKGNLVGIEVKKQGVWSTAVTVHWIIDHINGSILRDFYSTYDLFGHDGDWRILVTTNHDE